MPTVTANPFARLKLDSLRRATRVARRLHRHADTLLRTLARDLPRLPRSQWDHHITRQHQAYLRLLSNEYERQMHALALWTKNRVMSAFMVTEPLTEARLPPLLASSVLGGVRWLTSLKYSVGGLFSTFASKVRPILQAIREAITPAQAIEQLKPIIEKVKVSNTLLAKTTAARLNTELTVTVAKAVGCIGMRVYSVLEPATRPAHRARHLTGYYFDPGPGQKHFMDCPNPPYEADGTLAFGCLCWLQPIRRPQ
jgi:hypothetical protein